MLQDVMRLSYSTNLRCFSAVKVAALNKLSIFVLVFAICLISAPIGAAEDKQIIASKTTEQIRIDQRQKRRESNILKLESRVQQRLEQQNRTSSLRALAAGEQKKQQQAFQQSQLPRFTSDKGSTFDMEVAKDSVQAEFILDGWYCNGVQESLAEGRLNSAVNLIKALNILANGPEKLLGAFEFEFREVQANFASTGLYDGMSLTIESVGAAAQQIKQSSVAEELSLVSFEIRQAEGGVHTLQGCWSKQDLKNAEKMQQSAYKQVIKALQSYEQRVRVNTFKDAV